MTAVHRPFLSPGGKARIVKELLALFPPHTIYAEPYAGSASCFWAKPKVNREVLNDYDFEIVNTYTFLRDATDTQMEWLAEQDWTVSTVGFERSQEVVDDLAEQAYRFIYRRRASWGAFEKKIARVKIGTRLPILLYRLYTQRQRLQGVEITLGDGAEAIKQLDNPHALLFIDPPWIQFGKWVDWTKDKFIELFATLDELKHAKWIYAETPQIADILPIPSSWYQTEIRHQASGYDRVVRERVEAVYTNFPLPSRRTGFFTP